MKFKLSREESASVNRLLAKYSERANYSITLDLLLDKWRSFVLQVEAAYSESVYNYQNDLSTRTVLKELIDELDASISKKLSDELQPWDERFMKATNESMKPWRLDMSVEEFPWLYRLPKNMGEEFRQELILEGYLPE